MIYYYYLLLLVIIIIITATVEDLKKLAMANAVGPHPRYEVADFRFKGYVNDFMVSPRNPITLQSTLPVIGTTFNKFDLVIFFDRDTIDEISID